MTQSSESNASARQPSPYLALMRQDKEAYLQDLREAVVSVITDLGDPPGKGQGIIRQRADLRNAIAKDLQRYSLVGPSEIWAAFRERSRDIKDPEILRGVSDLVFSTYANQVAVRIAYKQRKREETTVTKDDRLEVFFKSVTEQLRQSRINAGKGDWGNVLIKGTEAESRKILSGIKKGYFSVPVAGNELDGENFIRKYPHLFPETRGYNSKRGIAAVFKKAFDDANTLNTADREVKWDHISSYILINDVFEDNPEQAACLCAVLGLMSGKQGVTESDIRTAVKTVFDAEGERLISKVKSIDIQKNEVVNKFSRTSNQDEKDLYIKRYDDLSLEIRREAEKFKKHSVDRTGNMNRLLAVLFDIHKDPSFENVERIVKNLSGREKAAASARPQNVAGSSVESLPEDTRTVLKQAFGRALNAGMQTKMVTEERQKLSRFLETGNAFFNLSSGPLVQTLKKSFNVGGGFMVESALDDFFGKPSDENEKVRTIAGNALAAANNALHIG